MPHIYCIEGHWDYAEYEPWDEPSVEPMLDMVRSAGNWPYIRRNSATVGEMHYWLQREWCRVDPGSILYIASHGAPGQIWLTNADECKEVETLANLAAKIDDPLFAQGCLIHFNGCNVLEQVSDTELDEFMEKLGASAVSGYTKEVGWLAENEDRHGVIPQSLPLESIFFDRVGPEVQIAQGVYANLHLLAGPANAALRRRDYLQDLAAELDRRFPECGFRLRIAPG